MSNYVSSRDEVEQERQQRAEALLADDGPHWAERYKPGSFGCHELLDRVALLGDLVEQQVLDHPACVQNREWFALAEQAAVVLRELYQQVGAMHLDDKSPDTEGSSPSVPPH
jgi:hypothetical protein